MKDAKKVDVLKDLGIEQVENANEVVTAELPGSFLRRLALVYTPDMELMLTCRKESKFRGFLSRESNVTFTLGKDYRLQSISLREISVVDNQGDKTDIPCQRASEYFYLSTTRGCLAALETLIEETSKRRREQLRSLTDSLFAREVFAVGDEVEWKPGLDDGLCPIEGETAIVIEMLATPIFNRVEPNTYKAGVRYDMVLGMLDEDGDFTHFMADSRRFTKVKN